MELSYTMVGNYLLPNIALGNKESSPLGRYGRIYKAYLREHHPTLYNQLLLDERLYPLCREIDEAANLRVQLGVSESEIVRELIGN